MITKQELEKLKQTGCCLIAREGSEQPNSHEHHICDCTVLRLIEALEVAIKSLIKIRVNCSCTELCMCSEDDVYIAQEALDKIYGQSE